MVASLTSVQRNALMAAGINPDKASPEEIKSILGESVFASLPGTPTVAPGTSIFGTPTGATPAGDALTIGPKVTVTPAAEGVVTTTSSSDAFYADQSVLIDDMVKLGKEAAAKYAETGDRKAADRMFYDSETARLKTALTPEVTSAVVDTDPTYDNESDPTSKRNENDCTLGVLKQSRSEVMDYLANSRDPKLRDLAAKSQAGDLASTYALIGVIDSWQTDMHQNAVDGKLTVDHGGNAGGEPLKTDPQWEVPAEYMSIEDYEAREKPPQGDEKATPQTFEELGGNGGDWRVEWAPGSFNFSHGYKNPTAEIKNFKPTDPMFNDPDYARGYYTGGGWVHSLTSEPDTMFTNADANGDGIMTYGEFEKYKQKSRPGYKLPTEYDQYRDVGVDIAALEKAVKGSEDVDFTSLLKKATE